MTTQFKVWPVTECKPRYYDDLADVVNDFTKTQIEYTQISIVLNTVVVGSISGRLVADEVYE